MTKSNDRFQKLYAQGGTLTSVCEIWLDTVTGVQYFYHRDGYSGGLAPLLDREGKPLIADQTQS